MIIGLGSDIVEIERIKNFLVSKNNKQVAKIFTSYEQNYARLSQNPYERFAVRFAAKEAFFKALGWGIFSEIEVRNEYGGRPHFVLSGITKKKWDEIEQPKIFLTLSHSKSHAIAVVVIES